MTSCTALLVHGQVWLVVHTRVVTPTPTSCCAASLKGTPADVHMAAMVLWLLRTLWYCMLASGMFTLNLRGNGALISYAKHISWTTLLFNIIGLVGGVGAHILLCCPVRAQWIPAVSPTAVSLCNGHCSWHHNGLCNRPGSDLYLG